MFEINRIGGPSGLGRVERDEKLRRQTESTQAAAGSQDEVHISVAASNIVQFREAIKRLPDIRQDRVEAARRNIEQGTYRQQDVVRQVAARVSKLVINE